MKSLDHTVWGRRTLQTLVVLLTVFAFSATASTRSPQGTPVLARVEVKQMVDSLGLPVHAHLQGADKADYALVIAPEERLKAAGAAYTILHHPDRLAAGSKYLIALERTPGARASLSKFAEVLHDDGRNVIVVTNPARSAELVSIGFDIAWMNDTPMLPQKPRAEALKATNVPVVHNPTVAKMVNMVTPTAVQTYGGNLAGDNPITVGGVSQQLTSRNTYDTDIDIATQYGYEFFQSKGLTPQYHSWYSGRNVVANKPGTTKPNEIVVVVAHLDDMPSYGYAPGADDNASGSAGVMLAAEIMSQFKFERTVRFVLVTGEEQGLLGSDAYAQDIATAGDNVVAVLNMDMIGWDGWGGPVLRLHTRTSTSTGYTADMAIADTFVGVVGTYGMANALTPMIEADGISLSDQASFWWAGYPAILAIEDDIDDFCANYHTSYDTVSSLNLPYWTNYIKASIGTAAHLAGPVAAVGPN